jgi:hypothetical protein
MTMTDRNSRLAIALASVPTVAFVLHDFVFQLPDNEGDVTFGFVVTIAGLLVVWAAGGYLAARLSSRTLTAVSLGALTGFFSVAMLWLMFIALNGSFLDRMSYEPDRILAFQQSGYPTLRDWWNHQHGWGPFPILMAAAALIGGLGGLIEQRAARWAA